MQRMEGLFPLDVDFFIELPGHSTRGRGLALSARQAFVPGVQVLGPAALTLHVAFPEREKLFRAECKALPRHGAHSGTTLELCCVSPEDWQLLGQVLLATFGAQALPAPRRWMYQAGVASPATA